MKNNKHRNNIFVYIILLIIFIFLSIIIYCVVNDEKKKTIRSSDEMENISSDEDIVLVGSKPFDDMEKKVKVIIDDKEYEMILENNTTSYDLLSVIPLSITMNDLNNNEKYAYLSFSLNNLNDYTGKINKGDVMLYQSNCIVIFYKDFDTTYHYTKIGHINNLPDFNNETINVSINN